MVLIAPGFFVVLMIGLDWKWNEIPGMVELGGKFKVMNLEIILGLPSDTISLDSNYILL